MIPFQWGTSSAELLRMVCQGWFKSLLLCVVQPVSQPAVSAVAAAQHIRFRFKQHRSQTFLHGLYNLVLPASLQVLRCQEAASGDTTKLLIQLQDGLQVEAVVMHYDTTGAANTTSAITSYCCICSPPPCSTSCAWSSGKTPKAVGKLPRVCTSQLRHAIHKKSSPSLATTALQSACRPEAAFRLFITLLRAAAVASTWPLLNEWQVARTCLKLD